MKLIAKGEEKKGTKPSLFHVEEMVTRTKRKSKRASNAVRVAGPVHSLVRIEIMSVCWGNIYLQCQM